MPKNSLYTVINEFYIKKRTPLVGTRLISRTDKNGDKYFLFELPMEESATIIDDYTLQSHHLSVYEIGKTQYHYTAFFYDSLEREYCLHLHYNTKDNYASKPLLSKISAEGISELIDSQENEAAFKGLADDCIKHLVPQLRDGQQTIETNIQSQYDALEPIAIALSKDLIKNKASYLSVISRQVLILEELITYSNPNHYLLGLIIYLKKLKYALEKPEPVTAATVAKVAESKRREQKLTSREQVQFFSASSSSSSSQHSITPKKSIAELNEFIQDLEFKLNELKKSKNKITQTSIDLITNYFELLIEKEMQIDVGAYEFSAQTLQDLHRLKLDIESLGKKIIERLLLNERYDDVKKLTCFYHLIASTLMPSALLNNNPRLIHFLLSNKIISPHYKNFTLQGTYYNSIAHYYFRRAPRERNTIDCVDLFIKNGLSLLALDKKSGLPFIAILLLLPSRHPYKRLIEQNKEATINNLMFLKQLNSILKGFMANPRYSSTLKTKIAWLIPDLDLRINALSLKSSKALALSDDLAKLADDVDSANNAFLGEELLEQLRTDPELIALKQRSEKLGQLLFNKLPRSERLYVLEQTKIHFDLQTKALLGANNEPGSRLSFEHIKRSQLKEHLAQIRIVEMNEKIFELDQQIKRATGKIKLQLEQHKAVLSRAINEHYGVRQTIFKSEISAGDKVKKEQERSKILQMLHAAPDLPPPAVSGVTSSLSLVSTLFASETKEPSGAPPAISTLEFKSSC